MFNLYSVVKVFVIGVCASVILAGAGLFYVESAVEYINDFNITCVNNAK